MAPTDYRWVYWVLIINGILYLKGEDVEENIALEITETLTEEELNELEERTLDLTKENKLADHEEEPANFEHLDTVSEDNSSNTDQVTTNTSEAQTSRNILEDTYMAPIQKLLKKFKKTLTGEQDFVPELPVQNNLDEANSNLTLTGNETVVMNGTKKFVRVSCKARNLTEEETPEVKVCNNTELLELISLTSNSSNGNCLLVMFFAPWCHFSAAAAPHFNALPRVFPNLQIAAIDAIKYSSLNTRFGTIGVPNILLFHNGRAVVRFNQSERNLNNLVQFVLNVTELEIEGEASVTELDYEGPLSAIPLEEIDYLLWLSWACILLCCLRSLTNSSLWKGFLESIRNNWREAEAQHEHVD